MKIIKYLFFRNNSNNFLFAHSKIVHLYCYLHYVASIEHKQFITLKATDPAKNIIGPPPTYVINKHSSSYLPQQPDKVEYCTVKFCRKTLRTCFQGLKGQDKCTLLYVAQFPFRMFLNRLLIATMLTKNHQGVLK